MNSSKLTWKFWQWPRIIRNLKLKLARVREISSVYYNDSKFVKITNIIDDEY